MNDYEEHNSTLPDAAEQVDDIVYNGSWENKGRNITAAAFAGLVGIGALYFNVQSVISAIMIAAFKSFYKIDISGNLIEKMRIVTTELKTPILISLVLSEFLFMLLPALWIVKKWHTTQVRKYIRLRLCSLKEILLAVLITISLLPFCYYLSFLILDQFKLPEIFRDMGPRLFSAQSFSQFILLTLAIAVTPAICEEIFFRGYVQRTMERTLGAKSIIITGIIFGLVHMQPLSLITLSILGILFSFFYAKSKSLFPSASAHFTNNFIALLFYSYPVKFEKIGFISNGHVSAVWIIVSLTIAAVLFLLYLNLVKVNREEAVQISEII